MKTNEEFVNDLMNFSPYGALCQPFITQAIEYYCDEVIKDKENLLAQEETDELEGKIRLISTKAWVGIAEDIKSKMIKRHGE